MALTAPAGTFDPNVYDAVRIVISGWRVRNDGSLTGSVGGHIIIQRKGGLFGITDEISIIEGDWVENASSPTWRLRTTALNEPVVQSLLRKAISWEPSPLLLNPGTERLITFGMTIGMDLIAGDQDLDIVAIVDRLPEGSGVAEDRAENAFSVSSMAPAGFNPVVLGTARFEVFTR